MWWKFRNALQQVHLWIGLTLSIPFILIGLSGSAIVAMHAIPDFYMPFSTSTFAASSLSPPPKPPHWSGCPKACGSPRRFSSTDPTGKQNQLGDTIFVDPVSLEVLGSAERYRNGEFMRFLTSTHLALMFPSYYGAQTVGWMGVATCLFGISGLILWWPRKGQWRSAFLIKRGTKGFRLNRDNCTA